MVVRLSERISIRTVGPDGYIEYDDGRVLALQGFAEQLATVVSLLRSARHVSDLEHDLHDEGATAVDLVPYLLEAEVLVPHDLTTELTELHRRTTLAGASLELSPSLEIDRILRDEAGEFTIPLPDFTLPQSTLADALPRRRSARSFNGAAVPLHDLSTLLGAALGMAAECGAGASLAGKPVLDRMYPSGGGLFMVETRMYAIRVEELEAAFYHFQPLPHRLLRVAPGLPLEAVVKMFHDQPVGQAAALLLLFMDFSRMSLKKYGGKAYRLALLEAGHMAQNALLVSTALGLGACPLCGFDDEVLSRRAGLEYPYQAVVYALAIGAEARR